MNHKNTTQIGYFIDYSLWQDALDLLEFQIKQKQTNRHFNTLSIFYYEKINRSCLALSDTGENYFNIKISSSLFYGLKEEFSVFPYVIPKPGLSLRDYKFFTYPMRVVYYAVGLYLVKLSQEFLNEIYKKVETIEAFYGGNLYYKSGKLELTPKNIYYRSFYENFKIKIKEEIQSSNVNKLILKLDIENYFNEVSIPKLLHFLSHFVKPSVQANMFYDIFTREQINCLFQFISNGKSGIPQSDNNIISSFIGYMYLVFGDLFIDDILVDYKNKNIIDSYKIIRYTDDIYISINFKSHINEKKQGLFIHVIASEIAEILYNKLGLKLNHKTKLYHLSREDEKKEILKNIRRLSPTNEYFDTSQEAQKSNDKNFIAGSETPQDKLNKIFEELKKIKNSKLENYFVRGDLVQEEILQEVFNESVEQILNKQENKDEINKIFKNFNFDLVKTQPLEILIVLLKDPETAKNFRKFCLDKDVITTGDADLITKLLCQTDFDSKDELLNQLNKNIHMTNIVSVFHTSKLNCDKPGYYDLNCIKVKKISEMPDVIEQIRLRIMSEKSLSYSVALNHLVNEIHAVCIKQEQANKKDYDVNKVVKYLQSKDIPNEICIKIRNLFDRRNSNSISHPGSDGNIAWEVTKQEYLEYCEYVGKCLDFIL